MTLLQRIGARHPTLLWMGSTIDSEHSGQICLSSSPFCWRGKPSCFQRWGNPNEAFRFPVGLLSSTLQTAPSVTPRTEVQDGSSSLSPKCSSISSIFFANRLSSLISLNRTVESCCGCFGLSLIVFDHLCSALVHSNVAPRQPPVAMPVCSAPDVATGCQFKKLPKPRNQIQCDVNNI